MTGPVFDGRYDNLATFHLLWRRFDVCPGLQYHRCYDAVRTTGETVE